MKRIITLLTSVALIASLILAGCSNTTTSKPVDDTAAITQLATDYAKAALTLDVKAMTGSEGKEFLTKSCAEEYAKKAAATTADYNKRKKESVKFNGIEFRFKYDDKDANGKAVKMYYFNVTYQETPGNPAGLDLIIEPVKVDGNWKINSLSITK